MNIQRMTSFNRRENSHHYNNTEIPPIIYYSCLNISTNNSSNTTSTTPQPTKPNSFINHNNPSFCHSHHPNCFVSPDIPPMLVNSSSEGSVHSFHAENLQTLLDSLDDPPEYSFPHSNNGFQEKSFGVLHEYLLDDEQLDTPNPNSDHNHILDEMMLRTSRGSTGKAKMIELDCNKLEKRSNEREEAAAADNKQRIRWTAELHDLFLDAIQTLGGPEFATPKKILGIMNVKGLSIYHVKSHLQKYRLAKNVPDLKHEKKGSTSSTETKLNYHNDEHIHSDSMAVTEALRMQIELQKLLHDQLKAQRELQVSIEKNGEFLKKLIEKQITPSDSMIDESSSSRPSASN